jgi:hypothetical protein
MKREQVLKCPERKILWDNYRADLLKYRNAVAALWSTEDFMDAYGYAEGCRITYQKARETLDRHTARHGCF